MKSEIRVLGIDDCPSDKMRSTRTTIIGTFFRGGRFMDGLVSTKVEIDGDDSTAKIIEMVLNCKFYPQLQCIMTDGIAVAGFNVFDINEISSKTKLPVIVVIRDWPDVEKIKAALGKLSMHHKIKLLDKAGKIVRSGNVFC